MLPPVRGGCVGDAAGTEGSVHPDLSDAQVGGLAHGGLGVVGSGADHDCVDAIGDGPQVGEAGVAFHGVRVRVDRERLVATVAQSLVNAVAPCLLYTSDAADE